jgi:hypothetical protein
VTKPLVRGTPRAPPRSSRQAAGSSPPSVITKRRADATVHFRRSVPSCFQSEVQRHGVAWRVHFVNIIDKYLTTSAQVAQKALRFLLLSPSPASLIPSTVASYLTFPPGPPTLQFFRLSLSFHGFLVNRLRERAVQHHEGHDFVQNTTSPLAYTKLCGL